MYIAVHCVSQSFVLLILSCSLRFVRQSIHKGFIFSEYETKRRDERYRKDIEYREREKEKIQVGDMIKIASKFVRSKLRFI